MGIMINAVFFTFPFKPQPLIQSTFQVGLRDIPPATMHKLRVGFIELAIEIIQYIPV